MGAPAPHTDRGVEWEVRTARPGTTLPYGGHLRHVFQLLQRPERIRHVLPGPLRGLLHDLISKKPDRPPLDSFETILKYLCGPHAPPPDCVCPPTLVRKTYKTGVKVTDAQMRELRITPNSAISSRAEQLPSA